MRAKPNLTFQKTRCEQLVKELNRLTDSPAECFKEGTVISNVGHFYISSQSRGYCLQRNANESGGVEDHFISRFHLPLSEFVLHLESFVNGIKLAKGIPYQQW